MVMVRGGKTSNGRSRKSSLVPFLETGNSRPGKSGSSPGSPLSGLFGTADVLLLAM